MVKKPKIIEEIVGEDTLDTSEEETTPKPIQLKEPSSSHIVQPPFPERLETEIKIKQLEFDLATELRNACTKIPLLQAIKYIQICAKKVRELCTKKLGRPRKGPSTIQVGGKLSRLMSADFLQKSMQIQESL